MRTIMKRAILVSLLFLATACSDAAQHEAAEAARLEWAARAIGAERGRINGLSIGSNEAAVVAAFGQPQTIEEGFSEVVTKPSRTLYYEGIEVYLIGDEIYNLKCRSQDCVTHDGIKPGDTTDRILAIFEKGEPVRLHDGTEVLRYPFADADVQLIIRLQDGKAAELELWFDYV